jgi:CheY-like chemotaxis protein
MKRILLVDDDPLILQVYQQALCKHGFRVDTAPDGLAALKAIHAVLPDAVVLDLMMPKMTGVEMLKLIRGERAWANLPVVVLSNAYMEQDALQAAALGAVKGLLKTSCTPKLLAAVIEEALGGKPAGEDRSHLLAIPRPEVLAPKDRNTTSSSADTDFKQRSEAANHTRAPKEGRRFNTTKQQRARRDFLNDGLNTCITLRHLFQSLVNSTSVKERELRLKDLYRKIHFVAAMGGLTECHQIAHMAAALEAVLFGMMSDPAVISPSLERTTSMAIDLFEELFQHALDWPPLSALGAQALVVDDDALANRLAVAALRNAQVRADSSTRPSEALQLLAQHQYDLVLLDIEMPEMNGFELSKRLRALPGYLRTPVIFVTIHNDFDVRAQTIASGGDDVIAKPILPVELAAKAVMHLLKIQMLTIPVPQSIEGQSPTALDFGQREPIPQSSPRLLEPSLQRAKTGTQRGRRSKLTAQGNQED